MLELKPFVTVAVVANLLPILPIVLQTVGEVRPERRRPLLVKALTAGNLVALAFAALGGFLLGAISVGIDDLRIAGGLILLILAIYDLLFSREQRKEPLNELAEQHDEFGLVPLGVPLMVGPATLATGMVVAEAYGLWSATAALAANYAVNLGLVLFGVRILDVLGHGTMRAAGKVLGLLLAGIAVSMIRTGIVNCWAAAQGS